LGSVKELEEALITGAVAQQTCDRCQAKFVAQVSLWSCGFLLKLH
jgi:hypothetical protein